MVNVIYEARGRAREYSELAANLYRGCDHGCTYCYAPLATRRKREDFVLSQPRDNIINEFLKDAEKFASLGESRHILLSFTTDPYQKIDEKYQLTRKAINILHNNNLKVSILTKGGRRSERDFDLLAEHPELSQYGCTLVFYDEELRKEKEPGAAPNNERIEALKKAHDLGIYTYVSLEPVWFPEYALRFIDETHEFVDLYKVGKLNYDSHQKDINWHKFREDVIEKLEKYGNSYYIKKDLEKFV